MITLFDHVYSPLRDNDLDSTLARFERAGFSMGPRKVRHSCGRLTGFALMTGSYLEFTSVIDEAEFEREATWPDRYFRLRPQPYGIGISTRDARLIFRTLKHFYPDIPTPMRRGEAAGNSRKIRWTFCVMPRPVLPGANVFAIQYHGRRARPAIRQGANTIFALGGFVFCTSQASATAAIWKQNLGRLTRVSAARGGLRCRGQHLEWISPTEYRRRTGGEYSAMPAAFGGIAAVKLLCADLPKAFQSLTAQAFTCVKRTATTAYLAPDVNTGFTFELIQADPAKFLRALVARHDSDPKVRRQDRAVRPSAD